MRFKKSPQYPGGRRTGAWHYHGSDTPTSPRAIYVLKSENGGLFYTPLYQDTWHINWFGARLHGNNAYGYYDWFAPEEGEEGYILAKHEGE